MKKNKNIVKLIFSFIVLTIGCVIAAFSIGAILIPNLILDGGVNGISIIASQLTGISTSVFIIVLNIPFLIIGYKSLGKKIMKLNVYDKEKLLVLSKRTLICRNIVSCWLLPLNVIFILFCNKTFGDYIMKTQILKE